DFHSEEHSGRAHGKTNVIPQRVVAQGDLRFLTAEQRERVKDSMKTIVDANLPGTSAKIEFHEGYPAMTPTEGNRRLLSLLSDVSEDLGYGPVTEYDPGKRGAGDISFIAEYVDALDGLGVLGSYTHAPGEFLDLSTLKRQIARTALLVHRLMN
ncbi:MAG: M20/M25/M40 family metallo-hydrolase, partial [Thermoanaerobaculia bacterium]|nr:M20/M25/M40 family metallo-hydrolase [Thermoanaerobaculia bacterium]